MPAALDGPRCTRIKNDKTRCKNAPIHGGNVCWHHGGAAPQVRRKAAERVLIEQAKAEAARELSRARAAKEAKPDPLDVALTGFLMDLGMTRKEAAEALEAAEKPAEKQAKDSYQGPPVGPSRAR